MDVALESNDYDVIGALDLVYSYVIDPTNTLLRQSIVVQATALLDAAATASTSRDAWQKLFARATATTAGIASSRSRNLLAPATTDGLLNDFTRQSLNVAADLMSSNVDKLSETDDANSNAIKTISKILKVLSARKDLDINDVSAAFTRVSIL